MNEPIISPWIFYLINVVSGVKVACALTLIWGCIGLVFDFIKYSYNGNYTKWNKAFMWMALVSIFLLIFVPSRDTMYKMIVSSYITPNNIIKARETVDDSLVRLSDIIMNTAKRLQEDKE